MPKRPKRQIRVTDVIARADGRGLTFTQGKHHAISGVPSDLFAVLQHNEGEETLFTITHLPTGGRISPKVFDTLDHASKAVRSWWKSLTKEVREDWKSLTYVYAVQLAIKQLKLTRPKF